LKFSKYGTARELKLQLEFYITNRSYANIENDALQNYNRWNNGLNIFEFSFLIWLGSIFSGPLGSLTELGGGIVLIPLLTLVFNVDIHYAISASIIGIIATSSGAAAAYVRDGFIIIRVGMFLEIATTLGALAGAFLSTHIPNDAIAVTFGVILIVSAFVSIGPSSSDQEIDATSSPAS